MNRNCAAIQPPTEDFRKAARTSSVAAQALCDSLTDSGKPTGFEIKDHVLQVDASTVKISQRHKDGTTAENEDRLKQAGEKWLPDC